MNIETTKVEVECRFCNGSGKNPIYKRAKCRDCGGSGFWFMTVDDAKRSEARGNIRIKIKDYNHIMLPAGVAFASWRWCGERKFKLNGQECDEQAATDFMAAYCKCLELLRECGAISRESELAEVGRITRMLT